MEADDKGYQDFPVDKMKNSGFRKVNLKGVLWWDMELYALGPVLIKTLMNNINLGLLPRNNIHQRKGGEFKS